MYNVFSITVQHHEQSLCTINTVPSVHHLKMEKTIRRSGKSPLLKKYILTRLIFQIVIHIVFPENKRNLVKFVSELITNNIPAPVRKTFLVSGGFENKNTVYIIPYEILNTNQNEADTRICFFMRIIRCETKRVLT